MTELTALRQEAQRLAETWNNVAGVHLAAGQGCACAVGGVLLSAADFELDIVDYVLHEAGQAGAATVVGFIDSVARRGPESYSLSALLEAMGAQDVPAPIEADDLEFILARLRKSLGSLEAVHRETRPPPAFGRRF